MESFNDVFIAVKQYCKGQLTEASYSLFIDPLESGGLDGDTAIIIAPNRFIGNMVRDKFTDILIKGFEEILGFSVAVQIQSEAVSATPPQDGNYEYTFDTFIVGSSNKFAHAAALNVATMPSPKYNPLFIYGDSGLGKTHLLNAISTEIKKNRPGANIIYVDCETFTNEIINAIKEGKTREFQEKYRQADVLLVDDIQFIAGKESTQEEFFHTFNVLHSGGKQIVLASDRQPKEIKSLEERLRTRFEWGIIADIQPPDFETRCAIIKRKSDLLGLDIKNDVIEFIASKVKTNIRQLEGVIKKLDALYRFENKLPNISNAQLAIKDVLSEQMSTPLIIERIMADVCNIYGCSVSDIKSSSRRSNVAEARKMAMYIMKEVCGLTMEEVGKELGGRDHATVVYNLKIVKEKMNSDKYYHDTIEDIMKNVQTI